MAFFTETKLAWAYQDTVELLTFQKDLIKHFKNLLLPLLQMGKNVVYF